MRDKPFYQLYGGNQCLVIQIISRFSNRPLNSKRAIFSQNNKITIRPSTSKIQFTLVQVVLCNYNCENNEIVKTEN